MGARARLHSTPVRAHLTERPLSIDWTIKLKRFEVLTLFEPAVAGSAVWAVRQAVQPGG